MAFDSAELSLMSYTGAKESGRRFYFYANSGEDTLTDSNFFDDAAEMMGEGDLVFDVHNGIFLQVDGISEGTVTMEAITEKPAD